MLQKKWHQLQVLLGLRTPPEDFIREAVKAHCPDWQQKELDADARIWYSTYPSPHQFGEVEMLAERVRIKRVVFPRPTETGRLVASPNIRNIPK